MAGSKIAWLVWRLPLVLFVIGALWPAARVWLWVPAMVVAGVACLVNAARCSRLHCHFTGPLYLLGAVATAFTGFGYVLLTYRQIAIAMLAGTLLAYVPEWARGKYVLLQGETR